MIIGGFVLTNWYYLVGFSADDAINGVTLSAKNADNVIQVWNHDSKASREGIERKIKEIANNGNINLFYKYCKETTSSS